MRTIVEVLLKCFIEEGRISSELGREGFTTECHLSRVLNELACARSVEGLYEFWNVGWIIFSRFG